MNPERTCKVRFTIGQVFTLPPGEPERVRSDVTLGCVDSTIFVQELRKLSTEWSWQAESND